MGLRAAQSGHYCDPGRGEMKYPDSAIPAWCAMPIEYHQNTDRYCFYVRDRIATKGNCCDCPAYTGPGDDREAIASRYQKGGLLWQGELND